MKRFGLIIVIGMAFIAPARAQLFGPDALTGALFGTFIGGIAGGDCHHGFSGQGAAIGAGVGLLAGAIVGEANRRSYSPSGVGYYYAPTVSVVAQPGYGYVSTATPVAAPVVYPAPPRPNYAIGGTLTGALAGGLIGAADGKGWEGAGIGAASGLVVGSVAEALARKQERKIYYPGQMTPVAMASAVSLQAPVVQPGAQPISAAPTTGAPLPPATVQYVQIPDAPRVPDAPTF